MAAPEDEGARTPNSGAPDDAASHDDFYRELQNFYNEMTDGRFPNRARYSPEALTETLNDVRDSLLALEERLNSIASRMDEAEQRGAAGTRRLALDVVEMGEVLSRRVRALENRAPAAAPHAPVPAKTVATPPVGRSETLPSEAPDPPISIPISTPEVLPATEPFDSEVVEAHALDPEPAEAESLMFATRPGPSPRRSRGAAWLIVLILMVIAAAAAGYWYWAHHPRFRVWVLSNVHAATTPASGSSHPARSPTPPGGPAPGPGHPPAGGA